MSARTRTQRITAVDIAHGSIRIPIGHKGPFPPEKSRISIRVNGVRLDDVAWDPRLGPDRERSGVLFIGARLAGFVDLDERLDVVNTGLEIHIGMGS
jgi:hypothetical protein